VSAPPKKLDGLIVLQQLIAFGCNAQPTYVTADGQVAVSIIRGTDPAGRKFQVTLEIEQTANQEITS